MGLCQYFAYTLLKKIFLLYLKRIQFVLDITMKHDKKERKKMINFRKITEENFKAIIDMKRPSDEHFVASNAYSLAQAWLYRDANDVYPFAIYHDNEVVGFMMLDEDLEEKCLIIWRIMFPEENEGKGYGTEAIKLVVHLAKESKKYDYMILDCAPDNKRARYIYEKIGFRDTGEVENGENIFRLDL